METIEKHVRLSIDGMGIVLYSPKLMGHIPVGTDFLTGEFTKPQQVAEHIRRGDITAFCTGSGGDFDLIFRSGYPDEQARLDYPISIRLGLEVQGGALQFCDLFWLMDWETDFPEEQVLRMDDGFYHITVCTRRPESGQWGDHQTIALYFNLLEEMPQLAWTGVPYLFTEE